MIQTLTEVALTLGLITLWLTPVLVVLLLLQARRIAALDAELYQSDQLLTAALDVLDTLPLDKLDCFDADIDRTIDMLLGGEDR